MLRNKDWSNQVGEFRIGDKSLFGQLKIDGEQTALTIHSRDYISFDNVPDRQIHGVLADNSKITLVECNFPPVPDDSFGLESKGYSADVFPHFILLGWSHFHLTLPPQLNPY